MTAPIGQMLDSTTGRTSSNPFITQIFARAPTGNDLNYMVGQRWINTADDNEEYFLLKFTSLGGYVQANWVGLGGSTFTETLTGNTGGPLTPSNNNFNIVGDGTTGLLFAGSGSTLTGTLNAIPNSALANSSFVITAGTGITIAGSPLTVPLGGSFTISASGAGLISTIDGDTGSIAGSTVTIWANNVALGSGSTVSFINSGSVSTLNLSDSIFNTLLGRNAGVGGITGEFNSGLGYSTLSNLTTGSGNSGFGTNTLNNLQTGSFNTAIGIATGSSYMGSESSNILINNLGMLNDNNTIRIGVTGSGDRQVNKTFIAGITGVTVSNPIPVFINSSTGQLGSAGTVATSYSTDAGSAIPASNILSIHGSGGITTAGSGSTVTISGNGVFSLNVQTFTSSGTYTPTANLTFAIVEVIGGGGGSGGIPATSNVQGGAAGGGGGGGYARALFTAATIGASQAITIGAGGAAAAAGAHNGGAGGTTSFGALLLATGGGGGAQSIATGTGQGWAASGGAGGVGSLGAGTIGGFITSGSPGGSSLNVGFQVNLGGVGGSTFFGGGGLATQVSAANAGQSYGGGASGGAVGSGSSDPDEPGAAGFPGIVIITEYI